MRHTFFLHVIIEITLDLRVQVMRAVNEMLLQAPNDGEFVELFPFFPANESVRNQPAATPPPLLFSYLSLSYKIETRLPKVQAAHRFGSSENISAHEQASFVTLRAKGGWLVSAARAAATATQIGGKGLVSGVRISATVSGTLRLVDPWPASSSLPLVSCAPAPTSPKVSRMSTSGRTGLVGWAMKAGQSCRVESEGFD